MSWVAPLVIVVAAGLGAWLVLAYRRQRAERVGSLRRQGPRRDLLRGVSSGGTESTREVVGDVGVAVALFGWERSPEMLVEMAAVLAAGQPLEVLEIGRPGARKGRTADSGSHKTRALERRLRAMAEERGLDVRFAALPPGDVAAALQSASQRPKTEWLVIEWRRRHRGRGDRRLPKGWPLDALDCNLATFRDVGVRFVREILVYMEPGPHDALVMSAAELLAKHHRAKLTLATWAGEGEASSTVLECEEYLEQLRQLCKQPAALRLMQGERLTRVIKAVTTDFDLLVTAAPAAPSFRRRLVGSRSDRLVAAASCSVLLVSTPPTRTHDASAATRAAARRAPGLIDCLEPALCQARLSVGRKEALFVDFADRLASRVPDLTRREVAESLWRRERTQNTAIGFGLAIPHGVLSVLAGTRVAVMTLDKPIDYRAADGAPVDVLVFIVGPMSDRQMHLGMLARVAELVGRTAVLDWLRESRTTEELVEALKRAVNQVATQGRAESEE